MVLFWGTSKNCFRRLFASGQIPIGKIIGGCLQVATLKSSCIVLFAHTLKIHPIDFLEIPFCKMCYYTISQKPQNKTGDTGKCGKSGEKGGAIDLLRRKQLKNPVILSGRTYQTIERKNARRLMGMERPATRVIGNRSIRQMILTGLKTGDSRNFFAKRVFRKKLYHTISKTG